LKGNIEAQCKDEGRVTKGKSAMKRVETDFATKGSKRTLQRKGRNGLCNEKGRNGLCNEKGRNELCNEKGWNILCNEKDSDRLWDKRSLSHSIILSCQA